MSSDRRPALPIRIAVLFAAIACLGLAMCARTQRPAPVTPIHPETRASHEVRDPETRVTPDAAEAEPAPAPEPYFPATKAAGPIYPQQAAPQPQPQRRR